MHHAGVFQNLPHHQIRKVVDAAGHHLHQVILRAAHGMAFDDVRLPRHPFMKGLRALVRLFLHGDLHERGDVESEFPLIDFGGVAADDPGGLKRLDAAESRRLGQTNTGRQVGVGHASVPLQFAQDRPFRAIQGLGFIEDWQVKYSFFECYIAIFLQF